MKKSIEDFEQLVEARQYMHTVAAALSTNRPAFLDDESYKASNEAQRLIWARYCQLGEEVRELRKALLKGE